jgi:hypothetical protein
MLETKFSIGVTQENGNFVAQIPQLNHTDFLADNLENLKELVTWHLANQEEVEESDLDVKFILKD